MTIFFEITPEHELKSPLYAGEAEALLAVELGCQTVVPANWPLQNLGEEGDKEGKTERIAVRRVFTSVHVDEVAHGLEGVKGDS